MSLVIAKAAAITGIGHSLEETWASLETGVCRYRRSPFVGLLGERHRISAVLDPSHRVSGAARGLLLATPALEACLPSLRGGRIALLLALDSLEDPRPAILAPLAGIAENALNAWAPLADQVADWLATREAPVAHVETHRGGGPACLHLLDRAAALLESGSFDRVLLGAVSSSCEAPLLDVNAGGVW